MRKLSRCSEATSQDLNEQVDWLAERKEELKQQVSALQGELDDSKRAYRWVS